MIYLIFIGIFLFAALLAYWLAHPPQIVRVEHDERWFAVIYVPIPWQGIWGIKVPKFRKSGE